MDLGRLAPASEVTRRTCLTILERAWSANFKMACYVLLRPLRRELDGQDPFQISGLLCQTRKTPTLAARFLPWSSKLSTESKKTVGI
jgi:hypothetical protein